MVAVGNDQDWFQRPSAICNDEDSGEINFEKENEVNFTQIASPGFIVLNEAVYRIDSCKSDEDDNDDDVEFVFTTTRSRWTENTGFWWHLHLDGHRL